MPDKNTLAEGLFTRIMLVERVYVTTKLLVVLRKFPNWVGL